VTPSEDSNPITVTLQRKSVSTLYITHLYLVVVAASRDHTWLGWVPLQAEDSRAMLESVGLNELLVKNKKLPVPEPDR
jgi:hypothetical protein